MPQNCHPNAAGQKQIHAFLVKTRFHDMLIIMACDACDPDAGPLSSHLIEIWIHQLRGGNIKVTCDHQAKLPRNTTHCFWTEFVFLHSFLLY